MHHCEIRKRSGMRGTANLNSNKNGYGVYVSYHMYRIIWSSVLGPWSFAVGLGLWSFAFGIWSWVLVFGPWSFVFGLDILSFAVCIGVWSLAVGPWSLVFGQTFYQLSQNIYLQKFLNISTTF